MTAERASRTQETRAAEQVRENYGDVWESPALLDTKNIPAKPGFVQRWVRTKVNGQDDQNNVYRKINQGWKPRTLDSVPKGQFIPHIDFDGINVIGIHGMILMERPEEINNRHAAYNAKQAQNQMIAARENLFRVYSAGDGITRPTMNNKSTVSTGRKADPDDD